MKKNLKAFTLSETLIVVVVLGIIATLTIPALVNKNKESVAKTKVRKAMAAYESALNKMIIENDLKDNTPLITWAGNAENNCTNSTNYFKKVQGDGCIFKTSDGIWWDISNIERPLIAFKQDDLDQTKAHAANDKTAFVLVGRFGTDGSLRVDDLGYETGHADQNSDKQVTKLYTFLGMKKSTTGGGQTQSCDEGDIVCKYRRGDTLPACSGEKRACVSYEYFNEQIGFWYDYDDFYVIYDNNGNKIAGYSLRTDGNDNQYKETEFYINSEDTIFVNRQEIDDNGNPYIRYTYEGFDYSVNHAGAYHSTKYKIDESGNRVMTCSYFYEGGDDHYEINEDCDGAAMG